MKDSMPFQEVVEAEGHLIDSHIMENIFDKVVEPFARMAQNPSGLRLPQEISGRIAHGQGPAQPRLQSRGCYFPNCMPIIEDLPPGYPCSPVLLGKGGSSRIGRSPP